MRKFQKLPGQALAVAASLVLITACGGGDDDGGAPPADTGATTTTAAGTTTTTAGGATTTTSGTGTTTTTVGGTTTTTVAGQTVRLSNFGRGFCIKEDGANRVVAATLCFGNVPSDNWRVVAGTNGRVSYQNAGSNRCLTVDSLTATPLGGNAVTVACDGSPRTLFTEPVSTAVTNGFQLRNVASTQCLEISAANNSAGGQVTQWECGPNQGSQTWTRTVSN